MSIKFIPHALRKFKLLEEYGFCITEEKVIEIVKNPDKIITGKKGRKIAQCKISDDHVLRVVLMNSNGTHPIFLVIAIKLTSWQAIQIISPKLLYEFQLL